MVNGTPALCQSNLRRKSSAPRRESTVAVLETPQRIGIPYMSEDDIRNSEARELRYLGKSRVSALYRFEEKQIALYHLASKLQVRR